MQISEEIFDIDDAMLVSYILPLIFGFVPVLLLWYLYIDVDPLHISELRASASEVAASIAIVA